MRRRDPELLVADPEYRIRNVVYGYAAELPYFAEFTAYIEGQPSMNGIDAFAEMILPSLVSEAVKGRHVKKMQSSFVLAWRFGVALGLLDLLQEVPTQLPARLP